MRERRANVAMPKKEYYHPGPLTVRVHVKRAQLGPVARLVHGHARAAAAVQAAGPGAALQ